MKLFAAMLLGGLFAACKPAPEAETLPEKAGYVGTLSVIEIGDARFELDGVRADYTLDDAGRLDIYLYDVSFSSQMPVRLSVILLPDVAYVRNGAMLSVSDTDIVPMMEMRGEMVPYERYLCTDFTGQIAPSSMTLSMRLGGFKTDYTGTAESR